MKHFVIFKFEDGYMNDEVIDHAKVTFNSLKEALPEDIFDVKIHKNIVERLFNGDLMVEMDVKNEDSLRTYLVHPIHVALTDVWGPHIQSRLSFDYEN